jgi:hypothetical protein
MSRLKEIEENSPIWGHDEFFGDYSYHEIGHAHLSYLLSLVKEAEEIINRISSDSSDIPSLLIEDWQKRVKE